MTNPIKSALDAVVRYAYDVYFNQIVTRDIEILRKKDEEYGASWLEYGGTGAFFVTVRKWDRIRHQLRKHNWDVFAAYADGTTSERFADTVMDFRNYLVLWEARAIELGLVDAPAPKGNWLVKVSIDSEVSLHGYRLPGKSPIETTTLVEIGIQCVRLLSPHVEGDENYVEALERELNFLTEMTNAISPYQSRKENAVEAIERLLRERDLNIGSSNYQSVLPK